MEYTVLYNMFHRSRVAHGLPKIMMDAFELSKELKLSKRQVISVLSSLRRKRFVKVVGSIKRIKQRINLWEATEEGFEVLIHTAKRYARKSPEKLKRMYSRAIRKD